MHEASPEASVQYKDILKLNGITHPISQVIVKGTGFKGENFGGLTNYVTIAFEDPIKKPLHLFIKQKTNSEAFNRILEDLQSFQIESEFFMKYIPVAREYCKSVGHEELMSIYPKCYFGDDNMIVLENLVEEKGFILLKKEEMQDFETAKFALTTLAKHHAISHAVIRKLGGDKSFLERFPKLGISPIMGEPGRALLTPMIEIAIDTNISILEKYPTMDWSTEAIQFLKSKKGKGFHEIVQNMKVTKEDFLVLVHGDYWNNNMMFVKDKDTNQILHHVMIDFQGVRCASPCEDLAYYLFTSVKPRVRREQFRELLMVYLNALKVVGNELGYPIHLSLQQLESDYCKQFYLGYWFGMGVTTGPGYEVMKDFDMDGDMDKMMEVWKGLLTKWVDEHPQECKVKAQEIIDYVKDYGQFNKEIY